MVTIDELKLRFGPSLSVAPYGECLVIQGNEFNPDWEADLDDQGFKCFFTDLDGHPVALVRLNKIVSKSGVVFVPPEKPAVVPEVHSNNVEVKDTEKVEKKVYVLKGPRWTIAEKTELLKEYDRLVAEGKKYGSCIILAELPQFKGRSKNAIGLQLEKLKKRRAKGEVVAVPQVEQVEKVEKTTNVEAALRVDSKQNRGNPHPKMPWLKDVDFWSLEEDALIVELWKNGVSLAEIGVEVNKKYPKRVGKAAVARVYQLQGKGSIEKRHKPKLKAPETTDAEKSEKSTETPVPEESPIEKRLRILSEAYESLSKGYIDLKTEFDKQHKFVIDSLYVPLQELKDSVENLNTNFPRHKHAVSGEAMLPMEASS